MSVALYDRAIRDKIAKWIVDPQLTIMGPEETNRFFQYKADMSNDKPLQLPLIAISRDRDISVELTGKRPLTHRGKVFNADDTQLDHLNAIPIKINYQIDIYTRYQEEADEYVRNFVFQLINYPKMELQIPYNHCTLSYISYVTLMSDISDNSDISERLIPGQFTRMTLKIVLNDAYLFSYNIKKIPKITQIDIVASKEVESTIDMGDEDKEEEPIISIPVQTKPDA